MATGMLEGVIKQMVNNFPGVTPSELVDQMKGQPQADKMFSMMKKIGIDEDKLKAMIGDEIKRRQ